MFIKRNDLAGLQRYRLQRYRLQRYNFISLPNNEIENDHQHMCTLVDTEQSLRETAQKEEFIQQLVKERKEHHMGENTSATLKDLAREYWVLERVWWRSWREIRESGGYLTRGFEQWRSYPQWYLHKVLREDCAMRDGCCSRDCRCCAKRAHQSPYTSSRKLGVGHCTVECACCIKHRGFDLKASEKPPVNDTARVSGAYEDSRYAIKLRDTCIWGVPGNSEPPSDQINEQPQAYTPKSVFPDLTLDMTHLSI